MKGGIDGGIAARATLGHCDMDGDEADRTTATEQEQEQEEEEGAVARR